MTEQQQIEEFLARKGATVCPPAESFADQAAPLSRARRATERRLTDGDDRGGDIDWEVVEVERGAQRRYLEIQGVRD